jgi:glycosyltransferase involved in cell wall biosynthesis
LISQLQLEQYIQLKGWIKHDDLDSYYKNASVVVVPSIVPENFPTVCNEAMSMGRPVIGTNVGGIPEIIDDGINGYLVEPKNAEQIAEKVIQLFSDEEVLKTFGRNARIKAEQFTIEKHVANLKKIYDKIMDKYKKKDFPLNIIGNYLWRKGYAIEDIQIVMHNGISSQEQTEVKTTSSFSVETTAQTI